ncbi:hypothetical protein NDU88_006419 [Pleurodeles waltl]|uniref:Uncharacterized protein n=1 Tax=Pleurodeles waltl TaxID=8319 RepID=A0AAV7VQX9_PLEWA|nr:hypothetical protein NDU88_006419 [Pleurodeles waltl]
MLGEPELPLGPRRCHGVTKEGADITVPSKEVDKHKGKRKVKPEETIDNWLVEFAMLSPVIMEKYPEQGLALCKYDQVNNEEYKCNRSTCWLNYDREFRQKMDQAPAMSWDSRKIKRWVQYMGEADKDFYFMLHSLVNLTFYVDPKKS